MKHAVQIFCYILLLQVAGSGYSQILPGLDRDQVLGYMAESYRDFVLREPPNASDLDFIKYEHVSGDMTLLVFMAENGNCRFTRLMVDNYYIDDMIDRFNTDFEPDGDKKWIARKMGEEFSVTLHESEWLFTVTVSKKENRD